MSEWVSEWVREWVGDYVCRTSRGVGASQRTPYHVSDRSDVVDRPRSRGCRRIEAGCAEQEGKKAGQTLQRVLMPPLDAVKPEETVMVHVGRGNETRAIYGNETKA